MAMTFVAILAAQLVIASGMKITVPVKPPPGGLRGAETAPVFTIAAHAAAPSPAPQSTDKHFYNADGCEDCFYKEAVCGCNPAMEFFACLTKHCHASNHTMFAQKCTHLADRCSSEVNINCDGPDTACTSKYNQLPNGGMGLTLDLDGVGDDAFCGPHGTCTGQIHMKVDIHPMQPPLVPAAYNLAPAGSLAPAPALAASPYPAAPAPVSPGLTIECGLPAVSDANVDDQSHWTICRANATGLKAGCDLPMLPSLHAAKGKKAYCVLTDGTEGNPPERLSEPAWLLISNIHERRTGFWWWWPWQSSAHPQRMGQIVTWALATLLAHTAF